MWPTSGTPARSVSVSFPFASGRVGEDHDHVRVGEELDDLERAGRRRQLDEGEVELAVLDAAVEVEVGGRLLGRPQPHARPLGGEPPQELGQDPDADRLGDPDPEHRLGALAEDRDVGLCDLEPAEDRSGVLEEDLACLGDRHRAAAARALDEPLPGDLLEPGDLLAHRRLDEAELFGCAAKRPFLCHRLERREVAYFDPQPLIGFHDQSQE